MDNGSSDESAAVARAGDAPLGRDPVATDETGRTWLVDTVREWLARDDRFVTVRPVIDL
ncbi:hypothetical protein [Nocardioides sp. cx-173]|uniref:hypothetical protein n=1 Tax=Nocardioides sp. cx-173 TaxID=2898796 RepID=UPI0022AC048C|nr:hypothetical protein [Nocardioides sp. cx-173]